MSANGGEIKAYLTLDTSRFDSAMSRASNGASKSIGGVTGSVNEVGDKMDDVADASATASKKTQTDWSAIGDKLSTTGGKMTTFLTLPIVGAGTAVVKTAGEFDKSMAEVRAITGATGSDFDALRQQAIDLGGSTAYSATEVADAMTEMGKAGWSTSDIMDGMSGVLDAAAASGEGLGSVSTIVADAISGFGLQAKDATHVADLLAQAANAGTIDITDMGESFKYVAPVAKSMNFSIEDCSTALLAMSNAGIKGSQAGTSLRTMMLNLANPTDKAAAWMQKLGIEVTNADGTFKSFDEIVNIMQKSFQGLTDEEKAAAAEAIAGKTGIAGMLSVVDMAPEKYDEMTKTMAECDGVAKETAETMQDNLMSKLEQLGGALESLAIKLGDILLPPLKGVIEWLTKVADAFTNLPQPIQGLILGLLGIVAVVGPVLLAAGKLITAWQSVSKAMTALKAGEGIIGGLFKSFQSLGGVSGILGSVKGAISAFAGDIGAMFSLMREGNGVVSSLTAMFPQLGGALSFITSPIGLVVGGIAVLVAAFVHLWNTNEEFRNKVIEIWNGLVEKFGALFDALGQIFSGIGGLFTGFISFIQPIWDAFCNLLAPVFLGAFQLISTVLGTILDIITAVLNIFIGIFTGNWEQAWNGIVGYFEALWNGVVGFIQGIWDTITGIFNTVLGLLKGIWEGIWNGIKDTLTNVLGGIKSGIEGAWNWAKDKTSTIWNNIKSGLSTTWENIKSKTSSVLGTMKQNISSAWENIKSKTSTTWENVKTKMGSIWDNIKSSTQSASDNVKSKVSEAWENIKSNTSTIWGNVKSTTSNSWNAVKTAIGNAMSGARSVVSSGLSAISNFFRNCRLELPRIKLPHFSISGSFSLNPPSIPHISVSWYKKAMDNAMILSGPTIFGMTKSGGLLGGGEAGQEVVAGAETLMTMVQEAVSNVISGSTQAAAGNIVIPVYIGSEKLDTLVVRADERNNYRNGGR